MGSTETAALCKTTCVPSSDANIQRLPVEILTNIFHWDPSSDSWWAPSTSWASLMLVCRQWRDIILHDQYLWSFISTQGSKPSHELTPMDRAKRAGSHPLTCDLHFQEGFSHYTAVAFCLLQTFADQICSLTLSEPTQRALDLLFGDIASFKALRRLKIIANHCTSSVWEPPNILFEQGLPNLTYLDGANIRLPVLDNLRLTRFRFDVRDDENQQNFLQLCPSLAKWHALVELQLSFPLSGDHNRPSDLPRLAFPALRKMEMWGESTDLLWFFQDTSIISSLRPDCRIVVHVVDEDPPTEAVFNPFRPLFRSAGYKPISSVDLHYGGSQHEGIHYTIKFNNTVPPEGGGSLSGRPSFSFMFFGAPRDDAPNEVFAPFLRGVPYMSTGVRVRLARGLRGPKPVLPALHRRICQELFSSVVVAQISTPHDGARGLLEAIFDHVTRARRLPNLTYFSLPHVVLRGQFTPRSVDLDGMVPLLQQIGELCGRLPRLTLEECPGRWWPPDVVERVEEAGLREHVQVLEFTPSLS